MYAKSRAQTDASVLKRASSVRCCSPVQGSVIDKFEPRHSMPESIVQHFRCNNSSSHVLNRNGFTAPVVDLHIFTLIFFLYFWQEILL